MSALLPELDPQPTPAYYMNMDRRVVGGLMAAATFICANQGNGQTATYIWDYANATGVNPVNGQYTLNPGQTTALDYPQYVLEFDMNHVSGTVFGSSPSGSLSFNNFSSSTGGLVVDANGPSLNGSGLIGISSQSFTDNWLTDISAFGTPAGWTLTGITFDIAPNANGPSGNPASVTVTYDGVPVSLALDTKTTINYMVDGDVILDAIQYEGVTSRFSNVRFTYTMVPEPASAFTFGSMLIVGALRRRR